MKLLLGFLLPCVFSFLLSVRGCCGKVYATYPHLDTSEDYYMWSVAKEYPLWFKYFDNFTSLDEETEQFMPTDWSFQPFDFDTRGIWFAFFDELGSPIHGTDHPYFQPLSFQTSPETMSLLYYMHSNRSKISITLSEDEIFNLTKSSFQMEWEVFNLTIVNSAQPLIELIPGEEGDFIMLDKILVFPVNATTTPPATTPITTPSKTTLKETTSSERSTTMPSTSPKSSSTSKGNNRSSYLVGKQSILFFAFLFINAFPFVEFS